MQPGPGTTLMDAGERAPDGTLAEGGAELRRRRREQRRNRRRYLWLSLLLRRSWDWEVASERARLTGVTVGTEVRLHSGVTFGGDPWLISIGDGTWITSGVMFINHDGSLIVPAAVAGDRRRLWHGREITVGRNCFVGVRAVIMPGVHIGDETIIGAASVVTRDVPARAIVAGNPARVVGSVDELVEQLDSWAMPAGWPSDRSQFKDDAAMWRACRALATRNPS